MIKFNWSIYAIEGLLLMGFADCSAVLRIQLVREIEKNIAKVDKNYAQEFTLLNVGIETNVDIADMKQLVGAKIAREGAFNHYIQLIQNKVRILNSLLSRLPSGAENLVDQTKIDLLVESLDNRIKLLEQLEQFLQQHASELPVYTANAVAHGLSVPLICCGIALVIFVSSVCLAAVVLSGFGLVTVAQNACFPLFAGCAAIYGGVKLGEV